MPAKPAAGKAARNKRLLIAAGLVAVALIVYLVYRARSGGGQFAAAPTGTSASSSPSSQQQGDQGSGDASVLAALAGENGQLLKSFLESSQGLASLAGGLFGGGSSQPAGEPEGAPTSSGGFSSSADTGPDAGQVASGDVALVDPAGVGTDATAAPAPSSAAQFEQPAAAVASSYDYAFSPSEPTSLGPVAYQPGAPSSTQQAVTQTLAAEPVGATYSTLNPAEVAAGAAGFSAGFQQGEQNPEPVVGQDVSSGTYGEVAFPDLGAGTGYDTSQITVHQPESQPGTGGGNLAA